MEGWNLSRKYLYFWAQKFDSGRDAKVIERVFEA